MKPTSAVIAFICIVFSLIGCKQKEIVDSESELILKASSYYVDLGDIVNFKVLVDGFETGANAEIYYEEGINSGMVKNKQFEFTKVGEFLFYAQTGSKKSPKIIVRVKNSVAAILADPQPDNFNGTTFVKKVIAVEGTMVTCRVCPNMIKSIHDFKKEKDADQVIFASGVMLDGTVMNSPAGQFLLALLPIENYPHLNINLSELEEDNNSGNISVEWIKDETSRHINIPAKTNITVSSYYNSDNNILEVKSNVKFAQDGMYKIGVLVLEDSIYSVQQDQTGLNATGYMNTHYDVIRGASLTPDILAPFETFNYHKAGDIDSYICEFTINGPSLDNPTYLLRLDQSKVVVFTYDVARKMVDNAVVCPVGFSHSYQYKEN